MEVLLKTRASIGLLAIALVASYILSPTSVRSQDVAIGQATATVLAAITVTAPGDLAFGDVMQGVPDTVANNDAEAGIFLITGQAGAGIAIYMQLPEYLSLSDGSGRLSISFSSTDASVDTTGAGDPTSMAAGKGWQNTNPHNLPAAAVVGSSGTNIYLGGKVAPSVNQKAGNYNGEIILTVAYNGS